MDGKTYFDTSTSDHHHFFLEGAGGLVDIAGDQLEVCDLPEPPDGMEIVDVRIVVRRRSKSPRASKSG
nr:hypothetical protein RAR13_06300 [Aminobacter aminovorans]